MTYGNSINASPNMIPSTAEVFASNKAYAVGDYVMYNGQLYCFTADHAAGAWNAAHVEAAKLADDVGGLKSALTPYIASGMTAPAALSVGDYVMAAGTLYRVIAPIANGATITPNTNAVATTEAAELQRKANTSGNYPDLKVGSADQLISTVGVEDKVPYNFRTTGGSADVGDRETVNAVVGGTVAWNQLVKKTQATSTSHQITFTNNGDGTWTVNGTSDGNAEYAFPNNDVNLVNGHKYLMDIGLTAQVDGLIYYLSGTRLSTTTAKIVSYTGNNPYTYIRHLLTVESGKTINNVTVTPQLFDLTQMFGSAIADYIYTLETATPGAGVTWFRKLFPKKYYAYDAGTLRSVQASAHKTVGFNAYDHSTGKAMVVGGNVFQITGTYTALILDGTTITPDASGYFTPAESGELTVTGGDSTTTCVHLKWDGERDGEYEPYVAHNYPLDSSLTLRGIPKLDADNRLYYDGDTYESDGTVIRKYGYRDYTDGDATDGSTMITDGVHTVYLLDVPTTESAAPYTNPQIVDDFGTEEYVDYGVAQNTRDVAVPVGHDTMYQANLRAKLEMAPNSPSGDGDYIVRQSGGENVYVPISFPADELPAAPDTDGTYVLKVTIASGEATYSWVAET